MKFLTDLRKGFGLCVPNLRHDPKSHTYVRHTLMACFRIRSFEVALMQPSIGSELNSFFYWQSLMVGARILGVGVVVEYRGPY